MQALARLGAEYRLRELGAELAALLREFPDLQHGVPEIISATTTVSEAAISPRTRRRPKWSADARKAVSVRMKKYWAARRKAKK
jgi:hypothetical protein